MELYNFESLDDVSDAAIEAVVRMIGAAGEYGYSVSAVRHRAPESYPAAKAIIGFARLIQKHEPERLVDPDVAIVREVLVKAYEARGSIPNAKIMREASGIAEPAILACLECLRMGREGK